MFRRMRRHAHERGALAEQIEGEADALAEQTEMEADSSSHTRSTSVCLYIYLFIYLSLMSYNSHHNSKAQSRETVTAPRRSQRPEDQKSHRIFIMEFYYCSG